MKPGLTVLLVDDVPEFRDEATAALAGAGATVLPVATATEALDRLDDGVPFDLLITRVLMPPGHPHGLALARIVKLRRPDARVLIHALTYDDLPEHERANPPGLLVRRPNRGADLIPWVTLALSDDPDAAARGQLTLSAD